MAFAGGDWEGAVAAYSRALRRCQDDPTLWANRAAAYLKQERPLAARRDALAALALDRSYAKALVRLGLANRALGRCHEAETAFGALPDSKLARDQLQSLLATKASACPFHTDELDVII